MYDAQLDPVTGLLPLDPLPMVTDRDLVGQRLRLRFWLHRGEWILDQQDGVPYIEWSGRKLNLAIVTAFFRREAETCPGVKQVLSLLVTGSSSRNCAVTMDLLYDDGTQSTVAFDSTDVLGSSVPAF